MNTSSPRVLSLFSGGLDGLLAAKLVQDQGVDVQCLHFVSPFFGKPESVSRWEKLYGLSIRTVDVSDDFAELLIRRPTYGFGSVLNPCVDCKILMLRRAARIMAEEGAACVMTGEVLGQRPMSQRRDTLNIIMRDTGLKGRLLRPLCALHMDPTLPELEGVIDRTRLGSLSGRGRKGQMALAARFGITEIPTPGGGCRLTEKENARAYHPVLENLPSPKASDFRLADSGRNFWTETPRHWLVIGRDQADNDKLQQLAAADDLVLKVRDFPGPLALLRGGAALGDGDVLLSAAALVMSYSPKACRASEADAALAVRAHPGNLDKPGREVFVLPDRQGAGLWREPNFAEAKERLREEARRAGMEEFEE